MDHKHMESEETSNDATMISELLKSAEVMQHSQQLVDAADSSLEKDDKQEQMQQPQIINTMDKHQEIPPLTAIGNHSSSAANIIRLNQGFSNTDDKLHHQMRHVHIPYILNGELYQIQTQDGENVTVKCCHCPPDRVYRGSVRSTGNFHMHIKRRHPDLLEKLHDMKVNALLERRDRLMRNRKISSRNNRNRPTNTVVNIASTPSAVTALGGAYKEETQLYLGAPVEPSLPSATAQPELSLLHTHKLKIKTVFQRHQMQQREAAEMRNWNNGDYVVVPIAKLTSNEDTDDDGGPINYCLKSQEDIETHSQQQQPTQLHLIQQQNNTQIAAGATSSTDCTNFSSAQQQQSMTIGNNNNKYIYDNQQRDLSAASSQSSISPMSNFSSDNNNNQYTNNMGMATHHQSHQHPLTHPIHQQTTLSIIKPEDLLIPTAMEQQAIDLTLHNDSGIFSDSNESSNNNLRNTKDDKRAGSQQTIAPTTSHQQTDTSGDGDNSSHKKWQDLLMQVETSLRDIQHEMNIRNQIESNRMFLDIAKFKFLHPAFQFNW